jgi:hypothetical protein
MTQGVQLTYPLEMTKGYPGQIADMMPKEIISKAAEGAIAFGVAVQAGTDPDKQVAPVTNKTPVGVSVRSIDRENDAAGDCAYADTETVGVMQRGYLYAEIDGTGVLGAPLTYIVNTGQLSTAAADASHIAINARLDEACATTGDLCRVKLFIDEI